MKLMAQNSGIYDRVISGESLIDMYSKEKQARIAAEKAYLDVQSKYDQLTGKLRKNANHDRN